MKRIFLTIGIFLLLISSSTVLTSCDMKNNKYTKYETTSQVRDIETEYPYSIYEVSYKGHDYIIFSGNSGCDYDSGCNSGVVHNPDCRKCNNM